MALVGRNEIIGCSNPKLDLFLKKGGSFVDVAELEFQIFDVSTPAKQLTPVQVYPPTGRAALDPLQDCPTGHRLSTGHYTAEWSIPVDQTLGSHEIRWFWKETPSSPEETFSEEFEVSAIAGSTADLYISIQDVRDAGIDSTIASDSVVEASIKVNQAFIERATRQWFNSRNYTLLLDGNTSDTLYLPVPVITVSSLKINNSDDSLDPDYYRVYNGRGLPDDRWNPRIKLVRGNVDIFADPFRSEYPPIFRKGRQNQEITGTFGFVEEDGEPPELIKRALLLLVIEKLANPPFGDAHEGVPMGPVGNVMRETTDGHTIQYTFVKFGDTRAGFSGYTMNREVHIICSMYKAPIGMAAPAARWIT